MILIRCGSLDTYHLIVTCTDGPLSLGDNHDAPISADGFGGVGPVLEGTCPVVSCI